VAKPALRNACNSHADHADLSAKSGRCGNIAPPYVVAKIVIFHNNSHRKGGAHRRALPALSRRRIGVRRQASIQEEDPR
jgi:hypothetical protein